MAASIQERGNRVPLAEETASRFSIDPSEMAGQRELVSRRSLQEFPPVVSLRRHPGRAIIWGAHACLAWMFLVGLLAIAAAIPVVNIFVLGYLMEVQGRVARTGRIRSAFYLLPAAHRLGGMLLAVWLWLLPLQLLAGAARDSWLLAPGGIAAWLSSGLLAAASFLVAAHLLLALGCGGAFWRFACPLSNARWFLARCRTTAYWREAHRTIGEFIAAFRLPHLFRLGLLGYTTVYLWLTVPALLFTMLDDVTSRWQVLTFLAGYVALTLVLLYLPWQLAHLAATGRWPAMFELTSVWNLVGRTPLRWMFSTVLLLACSIVPLLYLAFFKLRIPPHAARWDLMLVFLVSVVPARVLVGWCYHRAARQTRFKPSRLWRIWQWSNGVVLCAGVSAYVYFLYLAETGGELGERAVWQFHALLLPLPF